MRAQGHISGMRRNLHLSASPRETNDGAAHFHLNGAALVADLSGALWWPARRTVVVADLHLEKGSGFARRGSLLPPYDTRTTLERLGDTLARLEPERVICLGDSFHDEAAAERMTTGDGAALARLAAAHDWIWICGNHDPTPPARWGGRAAAEIVDGPLVFRHEALAGRVAGEVSGHFHPVAGLSVRGRHVGGRCFAVGRRRVILPAFGAYAGGLDVLDPAIAGLLRDGFRTYVIGRTRLHRLTAAQLRGGVNWESNR